MNYLQRLLVMPLGLLVFLAACGTTSHADVLPVHPELLNGDFAAPLDSGWHQENRDFVGRGDIRRLDDGGVLVHKTWCGWTRLSQAIALNNQRLVFRASARFTAHSNRADYFGRSSVVLSYLDSNGVELGETRWYYLAGRHSEEANPTRRVIPVAEPGKWIDLKLDIADELRRNLADVNPDDVKAVRVMLEAFGSRTQGC